MGRDGMGEIKSLATCTHAFAEWLPIGHASLLHVGCLTRPWRARPAAIGSLSARHSLRAATSRWGLQTRVPLCGEAASLNF